MYIYLRSQCLMSTFVVIRLFRSVSGCPYGKEGLLGDKICNSPWLVSSHNRSKAVLVLSFLKTYHDIFGGCFTVFRTISDIVFKPDMLPTDDFSNDRLVARARPIRFCGSCSANRISDTSTGSDQRCGA